MNYESIPRQLRDLPNWVCRTGKQPINPRTGCGAKANDPATWSTFDTCRAAMEAGVYEGIGFELTPPIVGVDLDHVIDEHGHAVPWAQRVIARLNSYTEFSPSGTGVHIFVTGTLPPGRNKRIIDRATGAAIEMYATGRYFTVTGDRMLGTRVEARDAELREIFDELLAEPEASPERTDPPAAPLRLNAPDYLRRGLEKDRTLRALWDGHRAGTDESSNDLALMNKLAYWCSCDAAQMIAAFRASPYAAQKDDAHRKKLARDDYMQRTAAAAIGACTRTAAADDDAFRLARAQKAFAADAAAPRLADMADIPYEPPKWLLEPYLQLGKGNLLQGEPGTGKTAFACALAAHVSSGRPLLGLPVAKPGNVLLCSVEDDPGVLRGRLESNGADLRRVKTLLNCAGMTFAEVEQYIEQSGAVLAIFDPMQAFIGAKVDMNRSNETRPVMAKLFDVCDRHGCACLIVAHTGKNGDKNAVYRSLGSVDIPAAMRSILHLIRNPNDDNEVVAVHVKSSNAPRGRSLAFRIADRGRVIWNGFSPLTVDDVNTVQRRKERGIPYDQEPLVQVLNQLIADHPGGGFWSYDELREAGTEVLGYPLGYDTGELKTRLKELRTELRDRDKLIVTVGVKSNGKRGTRIESYRVPDGFQTHIEAARDASRVDL